MSRKTTKDMRWHKERDANEALSMNNYDKTTKDDALSMEDHETLLRDDETCLVDDIMRHLADSYAWNSFDEKYSDFAKEVRNIILGLASDEFQPFNNSPHSIWSVVLIPYNIPPWLCMKPYSFMLFLLIHGPTGPRMKKDVYLQPLVEESKELWDVGIKTYDAYSKTNFILRATLL